jgi:hypothetical protein
MTDGRDAIVLGALPTIHISNSQETRGRHCERSEAIHSYGERLDCFVASLLAMTTRVVIPRACGVSSTPRPLVSIINVSGILDRPPSRTMTGGRVTTQLRILAARCFAPRNDIKSRHTPRMRGIQYAAASRFHHQCLWNTGSSAGACHRAALCADPVADDDGWEGRDANPHSRGAMRPSFASIFTLEKQEGAGKAGCALHPRSRVQDAHRKTHTSIQVQRRQSGFPCAMGLRLISRSPR